ncbi:hypothetical protein HOLleu_28147 [Holothuria leucospilota]|uniref:HTH CENPB-type domain-containing protein n=1 Tax=Holothuria leucospilota TaxID=206669 RepID=A0A9Q1BLZ1_HOLLE|nr:hypothetical protein HOLleu_28147 [Holothuria leucospilota]
MELIMRRNMMLKTPFFFFVGAIFCLMQGKYHRAYEEKQMVRAINLVKKKKWSRRKAAKLCGVPESSLRFQLKNNKGGKFDSSLGRPSLIPHEEERMLKDHIIHLAKLGYPLTRSDVLQIATQTAVFLKVKKDPSHLLSQHWLNGFLSRWPELKVVRPSKLGMKRAKAITKESISKYFNELNNILIKYELKDKPHLIFNVDETGFNFEHRPTKVVAPRGIKVNAITTDKGAITTILAAGNAVGYVIPPYFIFKGKHMIERLKAGVYPGSGFEMTSSGWSNGEVFINYIENHFSKYLPVRDPNQHILLLYDGHTSHISMNLINYALSKKIILFVLPPHSSHLLQPLDVGTFKPLKDFYHHECQTYMRKNPGQVITRYEVCQLISKAYLKAFTPSNLIASFRKSGIFPYNKDVIDEHHFLGDALRPKVPGPLPDTPAANSDYRKFLDDLLPQPKPIEIKKRKVGYRPGGVAITEEKIILKIKKVIQEKESVNKKKINPQQPQKEPSYEELDTSSSDESEMSEGDVCCICKRFSPPTLRGVLG